tara:strand:+ start:1298 stop:3718 length:2421 start_codon:yes stop_codon:yes gene_type:complete
MYKCEFTGEAMKIKKLLLIILLVPVMILGQDINQLKNTMNVKSIELMSDEELGVYWSEAQKKGYSIDQIKTIARAQGASELEILEFEKRIKNLKELSSNNNFEVEEGLTTSEFGLNEAKKNLDKELKSPNEIIFGSSFFNNPNISSAPSLNIATPSSYELGPGDELGISVWGAAENDYVSSISREGYLKIERIGPVYLSGLTIDQAKSKLRDKLSKIYSGLNSNYNKVFFDITLLKNRSIVVNITGNVVVPGTYTLSSLTSPLNALYAAGGPNENGSYREIKIIRGGKEIQSVDLYDYFVKGSLKSFSLRDQDVILVPSYRNRIISNGEFKTKGIFELKNNESISDLLLFNGGITSSGVKNQVSVERIDGSYKSLNTVDLENFEEFILNDGDNIEARQVGDETKNTVSIEGAVMVPGKYELNKNLDIRSLLNSAGGLKESALKERAYLIREVDGIQQEIVSINLKESMSYKKTYLLKNNDNVIIASVQDLKSEKNVTISGEVNAPGSFAFFEGATAIDLILMAKGITDKGSNKGITIYRSTYDSTQKIPVEEFSFDLSGNLEFLDTSQTIKLQPNDLIVVRSKLGYQEKEFVSVSGLVKKPGNYALKSNEYSVYDLIRDFDGFLPNAQLNGVKLKRKVVNDKFKELVDNFDSDDLDDEIEFDDFIEIGLDINRIIDSNGRLGEYNLTLKSGDEIIIPKIDNSIEVSGSVQKATAMSYRKGLTTISAINSAGGFGLDAKKSRVYVIYQNGSIKSTKSFLFFRNYPKLLPGTKVFVPKKSEKTNQTSVGEIVGYTTSLVSIIALIKSL